MANSSNINFEITARNSASGVIRTVNKDLGGLSASAGRAGAGMKAAFIGAGIAIAGVTKFIIDSTKAAMAEEKIQQRLLSVMKSRNMVTADSIALIEEQVKKGKSLAYSSDEVRSSLAATIPFSKDMATAQKIQNAAMEVAAAQNISLGKATQIVTRAYMGQGKSLVKLGIQTSTTTTKTTYKTTVDKAATKAAHKRIDALNKTRAKLGLEALAYEKAVTHTKAYSKQVKNVIKGDQVLTLIMDKLAGTAENSAQSVAKQFEIFQNGLQDLKQSFGKAFLPIAAKVATVLNQDIMPKLIPVVETATKFFTDNVPKVMAAVDPLIQKIAGENGLIAAIGKVGAAMWGDGSGPFAKAIGGVGQLLTGVLNTAEKILGIKPSQKDAVDSWVAFLKGEKDISNIPANIAAVGERSYADRIASANPALAPWVVPQSYGTPGTTKLPILGAEVSNQGIGGAGIGALAGLGLSFLPRMKGFRNPMVLASLAAGGYQLGSMTPGGSEMDALGAFAGGAGTAQALMTALPLLSLLRGGGGGGGRGPGLFSRIGRKILPNKVSNFLGLGAPMMPGMNPMAAMGTSTINANTVIVNAANMVSGMPGGMPMGPTPLDLMGPQVPGKPGLFSRLGTKLGGTRLGGAALRLGGAATNLVGRFGATKVGGALAAGAALGGGLIGNAAKFIGGKAIPILGGVMSGLDAAAQGKTAGQAIGNGIGSAAGGAIGATLLSWIPIAGPIIGGAIGSTLGGAVGEAIGGAIDPQVKNIKDTIQSIPTPKAYATGMYGTPGTPGGLDSGYPTRPGGGTTNSNNYSGPTTLALNLSIDGEKLISYVDKNLARRFNGGPGSRVIPTVR